MSRRARIVFFVLVAVQVVVPLAMAGLKEAHLAFDQKVRLKTAPVDPLDVFRGRYVALSYEISRLPTDGARDGETVYVRLHEVDGHWTGSFASRNRPDGTFIRGRVAQAALGPGEDAAIEYGIETYFVDERKAREYEDRARSGEAFVDVVIDGDGDAQIEDLILP